MRGSLRRLFIWLFASLAAKKQSSSRKKIDPNRAKDTEAQGRFYYLGDLLDRLDGYRGAIDKLRRADPEVYQMYKRIGGTITSRTGEFEVNCLPSSWANGHRPAFGFHVWDERVEDDIADNVYPRFVYFWKEKFVPGIAYAPGDTYRVGMVYYTVADGAKSGFPPILASFYVNVNADREVRVLKQLHCGRRAPPRNSHVSIPFRRWSHAQVLSGIRENKPDKTSQEIGQFLFCLITQNTEQALADMLVRATKNGTTAAFAINMLRTPYFFKDRDRVVNVDGKTRKIIHIVRAHERVVAAGKSVFVKSHFRGLRRFIWNGYDVSVSMPGLHHVGLDLFTGAGEQHDAGLPLPAGMLTTKKAAKIMSDHITARA
jgi:hypothetical protein|tara:strand:- start:574 stop:1689 length:1116 start_codon:yes stop_codon:yes gene_type:complete